MGKQKNKPQKMSEEEIREARKVREERDERKRDRALQRKIEQRKKALKRVVRIAVIVLVALAVALGIYFWVSESQKANAVVDSFALGNVFLELRANGQFEAILYHGDNNYKGKYTLLDEGATIEFTYDGVTVRGYVIDNVFHFPEEWDDGHGHGTELPRVEGR